MSLEKRLDLLLKAYKAMEGRDTLLILAGEGPRLKRLREIATALDIKNIAFLGGVPDSMLTPLYSASDVYVSASDTETFGLTFLEAMACGLPLLGVDSGGAKEMIIDGENGLVAKANNVIDLARKMESMKEEGRRRIMGEHSLRIARRYSIERVADQFLNIYKRYIN
jgi:glycosyltransferase involved in cell wall biosynthesis